MLKNQRMRILISEGSASAYIRTVAPVQVIAGETILGFGSGGKRTAEEADRAILFKLPMVLTSDRVEVLFQKEDKTLTKYTIYGLLAQLTLDGHPKVIINLHSAVRDDEKSLAGVERCPLQWTQMRNLSDACVSPTSKSPARPHRVDHVPPVPSNGCRQTYRSTFL